MPVIALTCIDPRLNAFFPNALALPAEDFIWLRNAGNIITSTLSSTMRSLALACAVKGGREIAIIGHTDCQICQDHDDHACWTAQGAGRRPQPAAGKPQRFFWHRSAANGRTSSRRAISCGSSPLIGPKIPVHGLMVDIDTGKLDWIVNGYETLAAQAAPALPDHLAPKPGEAMESLGAFKDFAMGEMKFPEAKIGEAAAHLEHHVLQKTEQLGANVEQKIAPAAESVEKVVAQAQQYADKSRPQPPPVRMRSPLPPKKNPLPPPIRPGANFRRG